MHFVEIYLLWSMYGTPLKQDYVIGTYFMGLGTAMVALSNHSALRARALSSAGKMALGIYAVHYVFIDILKPFDEKTNTVLWELSYVFIVFSLSYITVKVLANFSLTKKTVL
jgi:surface polysaccharide O-acyltransferase-like enzyme